MDMDRRTLHVFNRLRPMHLFKGIKDEALVEIIPALESKTFAPGELIYEAGKLGDYFCILDKGAVTLTPQAGKRSQTLEPGDFFGAEGLLDRLQPYTVTANKEEVTVLRLERAQFTALLQKHDRLRAGLLITAQTRRLYFSRAWEWLNPNERVYLLVRRHAVLLLQRLILPGVILLGVLGLTWAAWNFVSPGLAEWVGLGLGLPTVVWGVLTWVDWGNDFYFVTNLRVVYVEKIILIYDSRTTIAMNAISAVNTETGGPAERLLEYGDVAVKTLSGPLTMRAIPYPQIAAAVIEEQVERVKSSARRSDFELIKQAIKNRLEPPMLEPKPEKVKVEPPREPWSRQLRRHFSLQLRFDEGDTIIYRKHWFILLQDLWIPSVLILLDAGLVGLSVGLATGLAGNSLPEPITETVMLLVALVLFIPLAGWWLYQFEDWRNDIYQVTNDLIVDIYRKPLGRESRDSASLGHIQGLRSERPGFIGTLLNFGNVTATIPGKEFTFDGVLDPTGVQDDIQRRIEAWKARRAKGEVIQRREEMAEVLSAYYKAIQEVEQNRAKQTGV